MKYLLPILMTPAALLVAAAISVRAHERQVPGAPLVVEQTKILHSASDCRKCHEKEDEEYRANGVYKFIVPDCYDIWKNRDPHALAAVNIDPKSNPLAARMAQTLGYDVSRKPDCLVCHAVDTQPAQPLEKKGFFWQLGVGCEACHGVAENWFGPHTLESWRKKTPDEKEALGLVDLRDPAKRAAKCASCHVGDVAAGKFVTHQMYAAGHPPLLPFEPMTFSRDQPAHWRLPKDVEYFKTLSDDDARRLFHAPKNGDYVARSVAVGAIVNLRETVRMLNVSAGGAQNGVTLDFAHFDCFACHHELVTPSQRQARGYFGTPGRPTVRPLPTELAKMVIGQFKAERRDEVARELQELQQAFDRRPFGDAKAIANSAGHFMASCDQWLKDLGAVTMDSAASTQLLAKVIAADLGQQWDYDTAQQMAWVVRALKSYDRVGDDLEPLRRYVLLDANLGPERSVEKTLKQRLQLRYGFDPAAFATTWKQLPR